MKKMTALDQPRCGYTYVVEAKPATKAQLIALRDMCLEYGNKDGAEACANLIDIMERRMQDILEKGVDEIVVAENYPFSREDEFSEAAIATEMRNG